MIAMSRLNTTITDHTMITNAIAASLLVSGVIVGTVALSQNGTLTKAYDAVFPATPATQVQPNVGTVAPTTTTLQTTAAATFAQPAQNTQSASATVNSMQPSANNEQLTGTNPQNATADLQ